MFIFLLQSQLFHKPRNTRQLVKRTFQNAKNIQRLHLEPTTIIPQHVPHL